MKRPVGSPVAFVSEAEERAYWEREDSATDLDWRRAKRVRLPTLQPSTTDFDQTPRVPFGADQGRRP